MVKQIIKEAMEKNPIGLKEAVESELMGRLQLALEAKKKNYMEDESEEDDEDDELDEAKGGFAGAFDRSRKARESALKKAVSMVKRGFSHDAAAKEYDVTADEIKKFVGESFDLSENKISSFIINDVLDYAAELEVNDPKSGAPYKTGNNSKGMNSVTSNPKQASYVIAAAANMINDGTLKTADLANGKISRDDLEEVLDYAAELEVNDTKSGVPYKTGNNSKGMNAIVSASSSAKYILFAVGEMLKDKEIKITDLLKESFAMNESKEYDIPWDDDWNKNISKWERKYKIKIKPSRDFASADLSGKTSNIKQFVTKELDFDSEDLKMMGMEESVAMNESFQRWNIYYDGKHIGQVMAMTHQSALDKGGKMAGVTASAYGGRASRLVTAERA